MKLYLNIVEVAIEHDEKFLIIKRPEGKHAGGLLAFPGGKVEEIAKERSANLVHLDTFDFQAKDFYLKHGYEVFGVLEDCPKGHKRYYMKKVLG